MAMLQWSAAAAALVAAVKAWQWGARRAGRGRYTALFVPLPPATIHPLGMHDGGPAPGTLAPATTHVTDGQQDGGRIRPAPCDARTGDFEQQPTDSIRQPETCPLDERSHLGQGQQPVDNRHSSSRNGSGGRHEQYHGNGGRRGGGDGGGGGGDGGGGSGGGGSGSGSDGGTGAGQEGILVYLLPEDDVACGRALHELLPRLLPGPRTHAAAQQPSGPCAQGSGAQPLVQKEQQAGQQGVGQQGVGQQGVGQASQAGQAVQAQGACDPAAPGHHVIQHVIGLDAEWQPERTGGSHNRISVLQLAGPGWCLLFRLSRWRTVPQPLVALLCDRAIAKVGVGIQEDCKRLQADWGVVVQGVVDVRVVAQLVTPDLVASVGGSLSALTEGLLGRQLDKTLQCSAWGSRRLSKAQVVYAAHDAWASRELALTLFHHASNSLPPSTTATTTATTTPAPTTPGPTISDPSSLAPTPGLTLDPAPGSAVCPPATATPTPPASLSTFLGLFLDTFKTKQVHLRSAAPGSRPFHLPGLHQTRPAAGAGLGGRGQGRSRAAHLTHVDHVSPAGNQVEAGTSISGVRFKKPARHGLRKTVLYENCRIQAPDGNVLCTCSNKKINWYMERGLGVMVSTDPPTLRLHFEPRGRGHQDDNYYTADKANQCVVCGVTATPDTQPPATPGVQPPQPPAAQPPATPATQAPQPPLTPAEPPEPPQAGQPDMAQQTSPAAAASGPTEPYLRHSIVPQCYRKCFPLSYKSHLSHDIVLLCLNCHQVCGVHDQQRMTELGQHFNAPLSEDTQRFKHDAALGSVRSAARALVNTKVSLPDHRRQELLECVAEHYSVPCGDVDEALLKEAASLDSRKPLGEWSSHASRVVAAVQDDIEGFVRGWRSHFLDVMRPRFLPPHWSVVSRVANSSLGQGS